MNKPIVEVSIFDTTLRDGSQALPEANQFAPGTKHEIAEVIARLGVQVIEAGFPATPSDAEEVFEVAATVGQRIYATHTQDNNSSGHIKNQSPIIAGLSRANQSDIDKTWEALVPAVNPRIHTFISTDEEHMRAKFPGKSPEEVLHQGVWAIEHARKIIDNQSRNASVEFSAEAASTTEPKFLERVVKEAVAAGTDVINVPDTVGQRDPFWMRDFYRRVIGWAIRENPEVTISAHNHNDMDQATANTMALVYAAADYANTHEKNVRIQLETTICGLGERAGNADVFPVMASLEKFAPDMQVEIRRNFNPHRAVSIAKFVMGYAGLEVNRQSPIVGADSNVHRSGIHSDGVFKGGYGIYTPHDPVAWGHDVSARHEDGKYQGKTGRLLTSNHINQMASLLR